MSERSHIQNPKDAKDNLKRLADDRWRKWQSVSISFFRFPTPLSTRAVWKAFYKQGNITFIEFTDDQHGRPMNKGRVQFTYGRCYMLDTDGIDLNYRPPPYHNFWSDGVFYVKLDSGRPVPIKISLNTGFKEDVVQNLARSNVFYPEKLELRASQLAVGILQEASTIKLLKGFARLVRLQINVQERALYICFNEELPALNASKIEAPLLNPQISFRLKIPFGQLNDVWEIHNHPSSHGLKSELSFIIILDHPGIYHRKLSDITPTFTESLTWKEADTWIRQTRISYGALREVDFPTNLQISGDIMDIGRWNVLKLTLEPSDPNFKSRGVIKDILRDHNILFQDGAHFQETQGTLRPVWGCIDRQVNPKWGQLGDLVDEHTVLLPFPVRYQLEVCVSHGYLSEFNMTREFILRLMEDGNVKAQRLLEHVAIHKQKYLDPMEIFNIKAGRGGHPSTIYFNTPTVDTSNRITRRYSEFVNRFLRVRFSDEMYLGTIRSTISQVDDEVYRRVKATLTKGITVGDCHYEFLAFGNSQFREQGAYFFASLPSLSAADIRSWMGQFNHIRNVARYTSRLGQCFSTTRSIGTYTVQIEKIPDIERNGYNFSDGVGKISKFLAQMTMNSLKLKTRNGEPPSAFQFRLGGCKGMLVVSSDPQPNKLHIRPSQYKFDSPHGSLEIIRSSSYSMATLNRQLILILAALDIPMKVILAKQDEMLQSLNDAMTDDLQAITLLQRFVDPNQTTLTLANLIQNGFRQVNEPFVSSMLFLWKAWHFKSLKEKAKIVVEKGASLFGVLDESGVLQGWFDTKVKRAERIGAMHADKLAALPEVFIQISPREKNGEPKIIEGVCILARNPSLHPGDIRVVRAVYAPKLRHLIDVIVFPQTGDRDLASMCSGGDLDGDDYLIMWDPDLIPGRWFMKPMVDNNEIAPELDRDVTVDDMTTFFVTFMKENCLPRIANAHMAWADRLEGGVYEQKCIKLAGMHSVAVDYNKTGRPAKMTWNLEPWRWPHFMERDPRKSYQSKKILGRLYDAVETIHFVPNLSVPFDSRILESDLVPESEKFMGFAIRLKDEYDAAMLQIMAQFEIKTEFEVWSKFVLNHSRIVHDYKLHEDLGHITETLRQGFRQQCFDHVDGRSLEDVAPLVIAMYRVTHELATEALARSHKSALSDDNDPSPDGLAPDPNTNEKPDLPLISFPWIFHEYLGNIASGQLKKDRLETYQNGKISGKIYTNAEVEDILLDPEQGSSNISSAPLDKVINGGEHVLGEDEVKVKESPIETPSKCSLSPNKSSSGSLIDSSDPIESSPSSASLSSYNLIDAVDGEVSLMTFGEGEKDNRSDEVKAVSLSIDNHKDHNGTDEPKTFAQEVNEDVEADEVEIKVQEIVEADTPQSILKHLLGLVGI
ncbi:hypothetical protein N7476_011241 [Penicillium atrosanguineum]|uniref:RNA-dependent RNA polymerase n=1 Tax=Penicillium atrosanguineum TaxID=1132637 RepID=A0A9W9PM61_9EURO|nr:hypothetical protein N7476_011241 [Penicillium atrosanguineum]